MKKSEFEKKWLASFAPELTDEQYEKCFIGYYLWHIFSYGLIPGHDVLTGDKAPEAYERADKEGALVIQLWDDDDNIEAAAIDECRKEWKNIDELPELYVVGKDWKWTHVSTHENGWLGPYFYEIK